MSDQKENKTHHIYDDIHEEDNHLPLWWLVTLFGAIVFSFGYWFVYHSAHAANLPLEDYKADKAELVKRQPPAPETSVEALAALANDAAAVGEGEKVYKTYCFACHGPNAEGLVGPNLTDKFWIHGGNPKAIHESISHGYPDKGMQAWEPTLGKAKVTQVTAWVLTQRNKNVPGKAPQGTEEP